MKSIAAVLRRSAFLDAEGRAAAAAWAKPYGNDVAKAVAECPDTFWLAALGRDLDQDRVVDRWWYEIANSPAQRAKLRGIEHLPRAEAERRLAEAQPTRADFDARREELRGALDTAPMAAFLRALPSKETRAQHDQRIVADALDDIRALETEALAPAAYAGRVAMIGERTLAQISAGAVPAFIEAARAIAEPERRGPSPVLIEQPLRDEMVRRIRGGEAASHAVRGVLGHDLEGLTMWEQGQVIGAIETACAVGDAELGIIDAWLEGRAADAALDGIARK